ncbi:hypothetical protein C8J57DRAFT_1252674 [Mycena rebaudengoi]|nr:hypothetical protein C8J57DRAFT_1252674 [Mycena rebaudengoi]
MSITCRQNRQAEQHTPDAAWENTVMALRLGDRKARAPGYISCARQSSSADIAASLGDRSIDSDFKRNAASSYVPPHPCDPDRFGFGMWCAVQIVVAIARGVITVIVGDIADQRSVASHGNSKSRHPCEGHCLSVSTVEAGASPRRSGVGSAQVYRHAYSAGGGKSCTRRVILVPMQLSTSRVRLVVAAPLLL